MPRQGVVHELQKLDSKSGNIQCVDSRPLPIECQAVSVTVGFKGYDLETQTEPKWPRNIRAYIVRYKVGDEQHVNPSTVYHHGATAPNIGVQEHGHSTT